MTVVIAILTGLAGVVCGAIGMRVFSRPRARPAQGTLPEPPADEGMSDALVRLIRALPIGVVLVGYDRRVELANPAAGAIFGFDAGRSVGTHVIQALANVDVERRISEAFAGAASVAPVTMPGQDGTRAYRIATYPLLDTQQEVRWVAVFADDQTAIVRLERARREFLSNVSHELRTPLSSIKLMIETVLETPDGDAADTFLPQALTQVDRLATLIDRLMDQARTESGQIVLAIREVDLERTAQPIVATFEPQALQKGVDLRLVTHHPVRVEADPDRLAQIFVNLVDNALRHTPAGGSVAIELDARGADALIRVRDTGEGIPYRDLPRIFERFYVVDRSRKRDPGGAGLGLAIVKGIVDAHGGSVSAESMLGRGTTVTIRLPIVRIKREAPR